jgi:hypothetical protein
MPIHTLGLYEGHLSYKRASSPQERTSSTSKHETSSLFPFFVGHFCPPVSGSSRPKSMRIYADLDPYSYDNTGFGILKPPSNDRYLPSRNTFDKRDNFVEIPYTVWSGLSNGCFMLAFCAQLCTMRRSEYRYGAPGWHKLCFCVRNGSFLNESATFVVPQF